MRRLRISLLLAALAGLLLAGSALAMYSANYQLNWFVPLTGGGQTDATSASYTAKLTYGQTAIDSGVSASYRAGLGFWHGILEALAPPTWLLRLPMLFKH